MQALIDSESEVNTIRLSFAKQLGFPIRSIDIRTQKINGTMLDTYKIIVAPFSLVDKTNRVRFFEKTFLMAYVSMEIVFAMLFLTLSGTDNNFSGRELR